MNTLRLAARNLLRNRRRSLATVTAITLGCMAILLFGGFSADIELGMQTTHVRGGGHLQVQHRDYLLYGSGNPTAFGLQEPEKLLQALRAEPALQPYLRLVSPVLHFGALASNNEAGVNKPVLVQGIVPQDHVVLQSWNEFELHLPPLPVALDGAAANAAVIGTGVARVLQLCAPLKVEECDEPEQTLSGASTPAADDLLQLAADESLVSGKGGDEGAGPRVELLVAKPRGTPNVASLNVIEARSQGFKEWDEVYMAMQLPEAQRLVFGRDEPRVTALLVQLHRSRDIPRARQLIESVLARAAPDQKLVVHDFETLNPFYVRAVAMFDTIFGFIFVLIGSIVLFTVGNTMSMAIVERTSEIGTIRALGYRQAAIRHLFITEGLILGVVGAVLGMALALACAFAINHAGLTWHPPAGVGATPLAVRVWGEWAMLFGTGLGMAIVAVLSAWWPAHRAARLNIVDALRHV